MSYPRMTRIMQELNKTRVQNIPTAISAEMQRLRLQSLIKRGESVAITAGSRGITDIVPILKTIVAEVKRVDGVPFIVPAMGSHGGATAEGQKDILEDYGITQTAAGAPIRSSMEVTNIGTTNSGIPVFLDRTALESDHIIVVNRIKPHTEFQGKIESGLMKMMVIGLGKHEGTIIAHDFAVKYGYERTVEEIWQYILKHAPISLGIGIIENGYGQTAQITAVAPEKLYETEKKLLEIARMETPKLPFNELDILIVDECGKEISGTGMDTKVIGRIMNIYELEVENPKITRIVLRDLTDKTHGNAIGVGLADFVTRKVADKIDYRATYINSVTAVTPEKGRLPIVCENDKEALDFAIATAGPSDINTLRIGWIKNTSTLSEMFISEALISETKKLSHVEVIGESFELCFNNKGELTCL
jgi:hypothetical protein